VTGRRRPTGWNGCAFQRRSTRARAPSRMGLGVAFGSERRPGRPATPPQLLRFRLRPMVQHILWLPPQIACRGYRGVPLRGGTPRAASVLTAPGEALRYFCPSDLPVKSRSLAVA
jgi:hypothetical protein